MIISADPDRVTLFETSYRGSHCLHHCVTSIVKANNSDQEQAPQNAASDRGSHILRNYLYKDVTIRLQRTVSKYDIFKHKINDIKENDHSETFAFCDLKVDVCIMQTTNVINEYK